jgi:1-acyl-sn-glycerol-3-phosphate acyltransferase
MTSTSRRSPAITAAVTAVTRLVMTFIATIDCVEVHVKPEKGKGVIIVANHASLLDLLVGIEIFHRWKIAPYVFIRADYLKLPVVGWLFRSIGSIPAGRGSGVVAMRYGTRILRDGGILMIMPEGGIPKATGLSGELQMLMPGVAHLASALGTPILVAGIANTQAAWPPGSPFPRFHFLRSKCPKVAISTKWVEVAKASPEPQIMATIENEMKLILERLRVSNPID